MTFYGRLDSLITYAMPPAQEAPTRPPGSRMESLEALLLAKVRSLSDILRNVEHDIRSRQQLSYFVLAHIDTYYCYLKSKLLDLYKWPVGRYRSIEQRRLGIESLLERLHQEKRGELTQCWQDIARLRSEFRTWLKQYSDLTQRASLLLRQPTHEQNQSHR